MSPTEFQTIAKNWEHQRTQLNLAIYLGGVEQSSIHAQLNGHVIRSEGNVFTVADEQNTLQIILEGCRFSYLHPKDEFPAFVNPIKIECISGEICLILPEKFIN